jgi:hypothetical protein
MEGTAIQRRSSWCAGLAGRSRSSNHTHETDRRNQMHQLPAMRRELELYCSPWETSLIELNVDFVIQQMQGTVHLKALRLRRCRAMPSIDDYDLPNNERPDLTPYLIHLTKGDEEHTGLEKLESILRSGIIHGTDSYIKGKRKAACFMDIPFVSLKYVCSENNKKRYESYGVIIKKTTAYGLGARPVLYLSTSECADLGITRKDLPEELWRIVTLQASNKKGIWGVTHKSVIWRTQRLYCPYSMRVSSALQSS